MLFRRFKSFTVAVFSLLFTLFFTPVLGQENGGEHAGNEAAKKEGFNAKEVIFGHVLNSHEFHFFEIKQKDGSVYPISIPLPVILYSPQKGFTFFMSSKFEHGHKNHNGYALLTEESIAHKGLDENKYSAQQIVAVNEAGEIDASVKIYDVSLTRNVVQMLLSLALFVWIMIKIAKRYKRGEGVTSAPKGAQGLMEPIITFVRDEVAIPNLGHSYAKYLPFLLTVFFFILINNLFGMIPGSANVSGNIAFTVVLGLISFVVILASSNKHYWRHIFNPPGIPFGVKLILVPVEFLGVFIKPMALIIRLFANMVAGHIIIICLISLIFIFGQLNVGVGWGVSPVSVAFTIFIYFIEVLVAFIQAFIFAMLTAVFIGQARETPHHHDEESPAKYDDAVVV
ncbi:MAG: F0F1 ATP synthase subunit A [Bacteroidia bacterium]|nr:F0F1 ATP synthase subunit A [Bacteroidia bacterium]